MKLIFQQSVHTDEPGPVTTRGHLRETPTKPLQGTHLTHSPGSPPGFDPQMKRPIRRQRSMGHLFQHLSGAGAELVKQTAPALKVVQYGLIRLKDPCGDLNNNNNNNRDEVTECLTTQN